MLALASGMKSETLWIQIFTSISAVSASTSNITSLSNKGVERISKKYKSESTKEIILKGFIVYWLADDTEGVKVKAEEVPSAENPSGGKRSSQPIHAENVTRNILEEHFRDNNRWEPDSLDLGIYFISINK